MTATYGVLGEPVPQMPTLEGHVDGIVGLNPMVLQCRDCGRTLTKPKGRGSNNAFIILSRWHFHICEGRKGVRRCRDCLTAVKTACPKTVCKR